MCHQRLQIVVQQNYLDIITESESKVIIDQITGTNSDKHHTLLEFVIAELLSNNSLKSSLDILREKQTGALTGCQSKVDGNMKIFFCIYSHHLLLEIYVLNTFFLFFF